MCLQPPPPKIPRALYRDRVEDQGLKAARASLLYNQKIAGAFPAYSNIINGSGTYSGKKVLHAAPDLLQSFLRHSPQTYGAFIKKPIAYSLSQESHSNFGEVHMLNWAITFFLFAVIAAILGFAGLAGTLASIAKFLAGLFVILFVISLIYSALTGRRPVPPAI